MSHRLDAFCDDIHSEFLGHEEDTPDDGLRFFILDQRRRELPVNLNRVDWILLQIRNRRVSFSEVIEGDLDPHLAEHLKRLLNFTVIKQDIGLENLDFKHAWGNTEALECLLAGLGKVSVNQTFGRNID